MLTLARQQLSGVCFDVGGGGLRACQARRRGTSVALCDVMQIEAPGAAEAGLLDSARLARTLAQGRFRGRNVTLVLSPPVVSFLPLTLPTALLTQSPDRLEAAIKWEVSRGLRESVEAIEVRWWKIPHAGSQQPNFMVVALPSLVARACDEQLQREGLSLARITVSPCALARAARALSPSMDGEIWGILDIGLRQSTLTMVVEHTPVYVRSLPVGGPAWTRMIADALGVSPEMAETLKRRYGVSPGERGLRAGGGIAGLSDDELPRILFSVLRPSLETLVQEVLDSFAYVFRTTPDGGASRLWLAGGGAALSGLSEYLGLSCGSTVSPLACGEGSPSPCGLKFNAQSAASFGAALLETDAA